MRPPQELLYDSEASLRLVDNAIEELSDAAADSDPNAAELVQQMMAQPGGFAALSHALLQAYTDTAVLVARLGEGVGMLDTSGIDKLQQMHGRLNEVSSVTETATTDILDGLSRAVVLVERLDAVSSLPDRQRHEMAASLREELSALSNHLQFQDITSQQLLHVAALLADMRARLSRATPALGSSSAGVAEHRADRGAGRASGQPDKLDDPWTGQGDRAQAVADEIFAVRIPRKTA
jgi:uncharacterized phage infection (PIP) family protein YhgE